MTGITLKVLADKLGLTPSTVSRALNNYQDINADTRKRVQDAAALYNYQPSRVAQRLARGKRHVDTVGYVLPMGVHRFSDPFFSQFIMGIGNTLAEADLDLLITSPARQQPELDVYKRLLRERKADAFIVARVRIEDERIPFLQKQNIPFVCHGRCKHAENYSWYDVDVEAGGAQVARRFVNDGHSRVAMITPPKVFNFSHLMEMGFSAALPSDTDYRCAEGDMSEASGYALMSGWLHDKSGYPSAVFCGNDGMAVGVLRAIQEQGLRVGADVAVIGYGDFPIASYVNPPLTTLRQPLSDAGEVVTQMLLKLIKDSSCKQQHVLHEPELIVRASDRP